MELNNMFREFNATYGIAPLPRNHFTLSKTQGLIQDEVDELWDELFTDDFLDVQDYDLDQANIAKELTDVLYITMQRMITHGMDVEACLTEVHRSNMSKSINGSQVPSELLIARERYSDVLVQDMGSDRFVLRCGNTGKVIKPSTYSAADMGDK